MYGSLPPKTVPPTPKSTMYRCRRRTAVSIDQCSPNKEEMINYSYLKPAPAPVATVAASGTVLPCYDHRASYWSRCVSCSMEMESHAGCVL